MDPKNSVLKRLERKTGYLEVIPGEYITNQNIATALVLVTQSVLTFYGKSAEMVETL